MRRLEYRPIGDILALFGEELHSFLIEASWNVLAIARANENISILRYTEILPTIQLPSAYHWAPTEFFYGPEYVHFRSYEGFSLTVAIFFALDFSVFPKFRNKFEKLSINSYSIVESPCHELSNHEFISTVACFYLKLIIFK